MKLSDQEFRELRLLIQRLCGIWLGDDKKYLIQSRLEPVIHRKKLHSYAELATKAADARGALLQTEIIEAITTKETSFNRDSHPFEELRKAILPQLIQARADRQRTASLPFGKLRIWSAAASTGQEAYSLAIAILEFIKTQPRLGSDRFLVGPENFQILGTDISADALRVAKAGHYNSRDLDRGLDAESKQLYFVETEGRYEAIPAIKNMVEFQRLNLVQPMPDMSCFDIILCRNLLIYFDETTRRRLLEQLCARLSPGGILMLGAAESTSALPKDAEQVQMGKTMVYRKLPVPSQA
jgi:chemotaxis protein methyltransferase CheR